jgi:hypothetical protein
LLISKIISLKTIGAKRDVANEEGENARSNKTLSKLSYKFFNALNKALNFEHHYQQSTNHKNS